MHHWRVVLRDGAAERATGRRLEQTQYALIAMKSQRAARVHSGLMGRHATVVVYVLALVATIVAVDIVFFRHHFGERLAVNIGIVLVFGAFYFRFLHRG